MKNIPTEEELDNWAKTNLELLKNIPPRSKQALETGREQYLAEVQSLVQAVPIQTPERHNKWNELIERIIHRKVNPAMTTIFSIIIALALLAGGGGATVYASQDSQPDQALYPLKLFSEDLRLQLAGSPQTQALLNLEFADRRIEEIARMLKNGKTPDESVTNRMQTQLDEALLNAAGTATGTEKIALENLANNLERHEEQLLKLEAQANPRAAAEYARVVEMLRLRLELAEQGIKDPQALKELKTELRNQIREQFAKTKDPELTGPSGETEGLKPTETPGDNPGKGKGQDNNNGNKKDEGLLSDGTPTPKGPFKTPPGLQKKE